MKNLFLVIAILVGSINAAQALELEVAPLTLQARAEVIGVKANVDGRGVIVLTGKAAKKVARTAGVAIDSTVEMIVMTGAEVDELLDEIYQGAKSAAKYSVVTVAKLADRAVDLAIEGIQLGGATLKEATGIIGDTARESLELLNDAAKTSVEVVTDAGRFVVETGTEILGESVLFGCRMLKFAGFDLDC